MTRVPRSGPSAAQAAAAVGLAAGALLAAVFVLPTRSNATAAPSVAQAVAPQITWKEAQKQPAEWYGGPEAARVAETVLFVQHDCGGWNKNTDWVKLSDANREKRAAERRDNGTIDNGGTTTELRFLSQVAAATSNPDLRSRCQKAFVRGLDWLLAAQYENGGWPQFYPNPKNYQTHITFNDDAIAQTLELLRDVAQQNGGERYAFVDADRRAQCSHAVTKGIDCILRCQIKVNGRPTVWCAQHDEKTFAPASARIYEKSSFSGSETVGIVRFLMGEKNPAPAVRESIEGAVAWLRENRLTGIRVVAKEDPTQPEGKDKVVVADAAAPPLWARFYSLDTRRPMFCGRDGVVKSSLAEIDNERRVGYAWYTDRPTNLLERDYPAWKERVGK